MMNPDMTGMQRTRYFPRMVVASEDLTRDQNYHIAKQRYWNLRLHGWGILQRGLRVSIVDAAPPLMLHVSAGDAIAYDGSEITLVHETVIDPARDDFQGHVRIVRGDDITPMQATTPARRTEGRSYLLAIRRIDVPARNVPSPFGTGRCEPTVLRDGCAFGMFPCVDIRDQTAPDSARVLSEKGWIVLGALVNWGLPQREIDEFPRHDFLGRPNASPGDLIADLAGGESERAGKHLEDWKGGITLGLRRLLDPVGLARLAEIGPDGSLERLPAQYLSECPDDPYSARRLREFLERAESPYHRPSAISVRCLARLSAVEFSERVRVIFAPEEISDRAIAHTHRSASLLYALVKQWPAPTFRGLV